ncbi:MAG: DUF1566 domain-containing protein [Anaerolineales bacterium]
MSKSRVVDNGDGTVTDTSSGLMWQKEDPGEMTYEAAISFCNSLDLAGHSDWRLASIEELLSLANLGPNLLKEFFPGLIEDRYWALTSEGELAWAEDPGRIAYTVDFDPGSGNYKHPTTYFRTYSYNVRAVRRQ